MDFTFSICLIVRLCLQICQLGILVSSKTKPFVKRKEAFTVLRTASDVHKFWFESKSIQPAEVDFNKARDPKQRLLGNELGNDFVLNIDLSKTDGSVATFKYPIMELREISLFKGSWWDKPGNWIQSFRFSGSPFHGKEIYREDLNYFLDSPFGSTKEFVSLSYRYYLCAQKDDVFRNCPDPCNKEEQCPQTIVTTGNCRSFQNNSATVPKYVENGWIMLYNKLPYCECFPGYAWDTQTRDCVHVGEECSDMKTNPCDNYGVCIVNEDPYQRFICRCPPAYQGLFCEEIRNPCMIMEVYLNCQPFDCARDPENLLLGYTCTCNKVQGYERISATDPRCQDVDECLKRPCLFGSTCYNEIGDYRCMCLPDFIGKNCETHVRVPVEWLEWQSWSQCSVSCGNAGRRLRLRICSVPNECPGKNEAVSYCKDPVPPPCNGLDDITFPAENPVNSSPCIQGPSFWLLIGFTLLCIKRQQ